MGGRQGREGREGEGGGAWLAVVTSRAVWHFPLDMADGMSQQTVPTEPIQLHQVSS